VPPLFVQFPATYNSAPAVNIPEVSVTFPETFVLSPPIKVPPSSVMPCVDKVEEPPLSVPLVNLIKPIEPKKNESSHYPNLMFRRSRQQPDYFR